MTRPRTLWGLIGVGLAALAGCSIVLGYAVSYFDSQFQPLNAIGLTASGILLSFWSFAFGLPVVTLYGVPIFSFLAKRGRANWPNLLAAAALPGLVMAIFAWKFGAILSGFALPIAAVMRAYHGAGPNNSFKPNPHRGGA